MPTGKSSQMHYCCRQRNDVDLRKHYRKYHSRVYCDVCDTIFRSAEERITHVRTSVRHHCCQHCEDVVDFKNYAELHTHYKSFHVFCDGCHQFSTSADHRKTCEKPKPSKKKTMPKPVPKMRTPSNLYEILGISPDSSHEQVVKVAKKVRVKVHPDRLKRVGGLTEEQERAVDQEAALVGQAADILSDPVLRRRYDMRLHA